MVQKGADWVGGRLTMISRDRPEIADHFAEIKWARLMAPNPGKRCLHFGAFPAARQGNGNRSRNSGSLAVFLVRKEGRQGRRRVAHYFPMGRPGIVVHFSPISGVRFLEPNRGKGRFRSGTFPGDPTAAWR